MSTVTRQTLAQATREAEGFKALLPPASYVTWTIAGSVRRKQQDIGDIEHVVIPVTEDMPTGDGLFAETRQTNMLWYGLDKLLANGFVKKHIYNINPSTGEAVYRWGQKYRGVDYEGIHHEIFSCEPCNYGATLAIRTGSADFSKRLVTGLLQNGRRNKDGYVWRCDPCACAQLGGKRDNLCKVCDGTGLVPKEKLNVMSEEVYFELCGVKFVPPEGRK